MSYSINKLKFHMLFTSNSNFCIFRFNLKKTFNPGNDKGTSAPSVYGANFIGIIYEDLLSELVILVRGLPIITHLSVTILAPYKDIYTNSFAPRVTINLGKIFEKKKWKFRKIGKN